MRADFGRSSGRQYLAEIEHGDVMADVEDQIGVMFHHQHARAATAELRGVGSARAVRVRARGARRNAGSAARLARPQPRCCGYYPEMPSSVVVLPLPLGPISPSPSPGRIWRARPSIARTPP